MHQILHKGRTGRSATAIKYAWIAFVALLLLFVIRWRFNHANQVEDRRQRQQQHHGGGGADVLQEEPGSHGDVHPDELKARRESSQLEWQGADFKVDIENKKYPMIADFTGTDHGVYKGLQWKLGQKKRPRFLFVDNILSSEEADAIVAEAKTQIARSTVVTSKPGDNVVNPVRTSHSMFMTGESHNVPANLAFRRRVAQITGVPEVNIESTQVINYQPGQFYRNHPDYFMDDQTFHLNRGGNRFVTVLTGLMTVPEEGGGETVFPYGDGTPTVHPKKGRAVVFYSMDENGALDSTSMHEAKAPNPGFEKWVAVAWVRQREFK